MNSNAVSQPTDSVPDYLLPLLQATPSSIAKLIGAWDGLGVELQIQILSRLQKIVIHDFLAYRVRKKALDSPNAYVHILLRKDSILGPKTTRR